MSIMILRRLVPLVKDEEYLRIVVGLSLYYTPDRFPIVKARKQNGVCILDAKTAAADPETVNPKLNSKP